MTQPPLDIVGIGNAIVDVISHVDDAFLIKHDLVKSAMTLVDGETADRLYGVSPPGIEISGGSAANTVAGAALLGARGAFLGKVRDDQLGDVFAHDLRAAGVEFETARATAGPSTARSLIFVTSDAQRTMNTYLGACVGLSPDDIHADTIARTRITYLEGYLWDPPAAKEAFRKAMTLAHEAHRMVALTLSDSFCVERYRDEFLDLVEHHVDILFANAAEITALYEVASFDEALQRVRGHCDIVALTRSAQGSVVVHGDEVHVIDAAPVAHVIDTTGAGDLYAAGFLYGLTHRFELAACGRLGAAAAAEIISHYGARPETALAHLVEQAIR
jgi:sugar/nucleoside kinase (ribokinase family)